MYLIIGAGGFLGSYLIKNILAETEDNILATDMFVPSAPSSDRVQWKKCDITSREDLQNLNEEVKASDHLKVVYLAAYHHPDKVLQNPRLAWNINITALSEFLNTIENIETLYYPSTEVVYGQGVEGHKFTENDPLNPSNRYGEHKTVAERMVNVAGFNVVRFPVLMGPSLALGKKHFYDEIRQTLEQGNDIEMFTDNLRSMIDFDTAARMVVRLIETPSARSAKIVNIAGDEALSKYEFACRLAAKYNLDKKHIIPISMDDDNKIFTAKRSKETLLDNSLLKQLLNLSELKIKI